MSGVGPWKKCSSFPGRKHRTWCKNIVRVEEKRLSLAAHKAARQERLLDDPTLPDEQVKPVDRKLHQLQTQPLTAEEESQEGR